MTDEGVWETGWLSASFLSVQALDPFVKLALGTRLRERLRRGVPDDAPNRSMFLRRALPKARLQPERGFPGPPAHRVRLPAASFRLDRMRGTNGWRPLWLILHSDPLAVDRIEGNLVELWKHPLNAIVFRVCVSRAPKLGVHVASLQVKL